MDRSRYHLATGDLQRYECWSLCGSLRRHRSQSGELDTFSMCALRLGSDTGRYHWSVSALQSLLYSTTRILISTTATFLAVILAVGALLSPSSTGVQVILTLLFPPMFYTFFTKALASYENIPLTPNILRQSPNGDAPVLALLIVAIVGRCVEPMDRFWD